MLSQSRIKSWESKPCPRKWQAENVTGELVRYSNIDMQYGNYFEFLAIGGSSGYQSNVTDLPRLKSGAKSVDQQRIEMQAGKFRRMFDPDDSEFIGWEIHKTQIKLSLDDIEGTIDFSANKGSKFKPWDLKLTADLESERSFWSNLEALDPLQPSIYNYLWNAYNEPTDQFGYAVFDYSPKMNVAIIDVTVTDKAIEAALKRFKEAENTMGEYGNEWPRIPSPNDCRYCKLDCPVKINKAGYIYKSIVI